MHRNYTINRLPVELVNKYYCAWNSTGFIIPGACPLIGACGHRINAPCWVNEVVLFDFGIAVLQNMQYSRIGKSDMIILPRWKPVLLRGRTGGLTSDYYRILKI